MVIAARLVLESRKDRYVADATGDSRNHRVPDAAAPTGLRTRPLARVGDNNIAIGLHNACTCPGVANEPGGGDSSWCDVKRNCVVTNVLW